MPPHELHLNVGAPIILLRNLNPSMGLVNGTRMVVRALGRRALDAEIMTGSHVGRPVLIPRITLSASDAELPFDMQRRQFPVRAAFAMTINKSQGQTLAMVGLYQPQPVFSHGQLYVALSRVGSPDRVKVLVKPRVAGDTGHLPVRGPPGVYTRNIVFREVLPQ
mgnify:CR=1 FL=1